MRYLYVTVTGILLLFCWTIKQIILKIYMYEFLYGVCGQIIFGSTVLLMLWLPVRVIRKVLPGFLPYHVMLSRWVLESKYKNPLAVPFKKVNFFQRKCSGEVKGIVVCLFTSTCNLHDFPITSENRFFFCNNMLAASNISILWLILLAC